MTGALLPLAPGPVMLMVVRPLVSASVSGVLVHTDHRVTSEAQQIRCSAGTTSGVITAAVCGFAEAAACTVQPVKCFVLQVWMCVNKKLKPIDCVEAPHPHRSAAAGGAQARPPSPNWFCNYVIIPKLRDNLLQAKGPELLAPTAGQQRAAAQDVASANRQVSQDTAVSYPEQQRGMPTQQ